MQVKLPFKIVATLLLTIVISIVSNNVYSHSRSVHGESRSIQGVTRHSSGEARSLQSILRALKAKQTKAVIIIPLSSDVLFDFDKSSLKPQALSSLKNLALVMKKAKAKSVTIEGHTDSVGSDAYNQKLSLRRAYAVKGWLAKNKALPKAPLKVVGFGKRAPIAKNRINGKDNPAGRKKNRRVVVAIYKIQ